MNVPASMSLMQFLTETKTGFCQQFATAMAAMLRSLGIPARVAVGFTRGDYDEGSGLYTVSSHDAHTWVEVRFPTYGWIPFEPTPGPRNPAAATYQPRVSAVRTERVPRGENAVGVKPSPATSVARKPAGVRRSRERVGAPLPPIPTVTVPAPSPWTPQRLLWIAVGLVALGAPLGPAVQSLASSSPAPPREARSAPADPGDLRRVHPTRGRTRVRAQPR